MDGKKGICRLVFCLIVCTPILKLNSDEITEMQVAKVFTKLKRSVVDEAEVKEKRRQNED